MPQTKLMWKHLAKMCFKLPGGRKENEVHVEELAAKGQIADVCYFSLCVFLPMAFSGH